MEELQDPHTFPTRDAIRRGWVILAVVAATLALLIGLSVGYTWGSRDGNSSLLPASAKLEAFDEDLVQALYGQAIPAVAQIETRAVSEGPLGFPFQQRGQGSAFLVGANGEFLTNYHVIEGASRVTVILEDGSRLQGEVIGSDPASDLALVGVDPSRVAKIVPLTLADSEQVRPGQLAIALGSPFGLQGSITVGVVSGIGRSVTSPARRRISGVIQTDAAIFPGNSGGPLLNSSGEVIGINTAIASQGSESLGFAVPSNTASRILSRLTAGVTIKRAWLGVSLITIDEEQAELLGLDRVAGAYVADVVEGSPAEQAGLVGGGSSLELGQAGDLILAVDGKDVLSVDDLISYFNTREPGDEVTFKVYRDGREVEIRATLGEWPASLS